MGYIFEQEIESIMNAVRVKTIGEDDEVLLKHILGSSIHPAIKAYFKAEVENNLRQEREQENRSKKFPYGIPEVVSLQQQIDLLLVQNYRFDRTEFEALLDDAVHFQFNYLCRPQWTLLNFIVGETRRVKASVIEKKLHYCVDYDYFPELIKLYMVAHGVAEMLYEDFKSLLEKIDQEVIAQHSSTELAHMTKALFEFVESGKLMPKQEFVEQTLPINAAIVFFEDKKMNDVRVRLEFERDRNMVQSITVGKLADIIEIVRTGNEEAVAVEPAVLQKNDLEITDVPVDVESVPDQSVETEHEKNTQSPKGETMKPVLLFNENDDILTAATDKKQKEILSLFTKSECEKIISELFKKEELSFISLIRDISAAEAWDRVAHYLDTVFVKNQTDPFSEQAVFFTDKLFAYFNSSLK